MPDRWSKHSYTIQQRLTLLSEEHAVMREALEDVRAEKTSCSNWTQDEWEYFSEKVAKMSNIAEKALAKIGVDKSANM